MHVLLNKAVLVHCASQQIPETSCRLSSSSAFISSVNAEISVQIQTYMTRECSHLRQTNNTAVKCFGIAVAIHLDCIQIFVNF